MPLNHYQQEVGPSLADASPGKVPDVALLEGRYCSVEHLTVAEHYKDILDFYFTNQILSDWTYMYADPFESEEAVRQCLEDYEQSQNPYFFAIRDKASGKVLGTFSLMAITPKNRSVEMGRVILAPVLQKTRAATEAQYLLMKYVFEDLNYRRYEWKCDSLNRPSANAAMRLGFTYEGRFRNHAIYKGRSRDTDWFSIIDSEWPALKKRFENWLDPENFDEKGQQKHSLRDC